MKVDLIRKFKWYIIGFILVAIMLSVSLSFCAWDTLSIKASLSGKGGGYRNRIKVNQYVTLEEDRFLPNNVPGLNDQVDVGDIVTFGKYYQDLTKSGDIAEKTPIRWIVVEKINNQLTLLAEKVMAFGSFWGNWHNDGTNNVYNADWGAGWNWGAVTNGYHYQNYSQSTLRAWLNSNYTLRDDAGAAFSAGNSQPRFRGFMSEAFTADEQAYIIDKPISGMRGYSKDNDSSRDEAYASVTDKVWVPSWSEVYGTTLAKYNSWQTPIDGDWNTYDGSPNARFSYFNGAVYNQDNPILNVYTTAYASSQYSNYTVDGSTSAPNYQNSVEGNNVWWWLRSPTPSYYANTLIVYYRGAGTCAYTGNSSGGVRPAVCVPL